MALRDISRSSLLDINSFPYCSMGTRGNLRSMDNPDIYTLRTKVDNAWNPLRVETEALANVASDYEASPAEKKRFKHFLTLHESWQFWSLEAMKLVSMQVDGSRNGILQRPLSTMPRRQRPGSRVISRMA